MEDKQEKRSFMGIKYKPIHISIDLRGKKKRWLRILLYCLGALVMVILLAVLLKPEKQLMNTAEVKRIVDRGILNVGVRTDMPRYAENGVGLEIKLARRFAEYLLPEHADGTEIKFIEVTNRTAETKLTDGTIDAAFALMQRGASNKFAYSYPYCTDECWLLVRKGDEDKPLDMMVIGYVQNTASANVLNDYIAEHETSVERTLLDKLLGREPELPEGAITFTKKAFASYPDLMMALGNGRIDAAAMTEAYINKYRDINGNFNGYRFFLHNISLGKAEYAIAVSGDEPAIAQLADMFIYELEQSGELSDLMEKYGLIQ